MDPAPALRKSIRLLILGSLALLSISGCTIILFDQPIDINATSTPNYPTALPPTPQAMAQVTFEVAIPAPLLPGEKLYLSLVDEVTGLGFNSTDSEMQGRDALHYTYSMPLAMSSNVKYRYLRKAGMRVVEDDPANRQVRYRMFYVTGPGTVQDAVAAWSDGQFSGPVGRATGRVVSAVDGAPLMNILIAAGGQQTLTDSNGNFYLEELLPGTNNLAAYALDGMYQTYQQGATILAGGTTPVEITLKPAPLVNITFTVRVPGDTLPSIPIRLAGNLLQLGNTFGDLDGGFSTVAARMLILQAAPSGLYTATLALPAGADVQYKYTLGDGFWNAEHRYDESFRVRQLIVPQSDSVIQDVVETWRAGPSAPILFEATVPSGTPYADTVSIQFNPYGWAEPIPMWPLGQNRWLYQLYSPLNMLFEFEYRYCRNDQCSSADDVTTAGGHRGRIITTSLTPQYMQDTVDAWMWLDPTATSSVTGLAVQPRSAGFWAGVETQADYDPSWQAWMPEALQDIQSVGSNWVVLAPTWTYERLSPLVFSLIPGRDALWNDLTVTINQARALNLDVALFPQPHFPLAVKDWWAAAPKDPLWWNAWFEHYRAFAIHHADLAARTGAQALILGGDWIGPALPGSSGYNLPADAEARWNVLLADVRKQFSGLVYWALPYPGGLTGAPAFLKNLDGIYLLWSAPLSSAENPAIETMMAEAGRLLDAEVYPFQAALNKPLVLAAAYPSVTGAAKACWSDGQGGCLHWTALDQPGDNPAFSVNLQAQADIYQALLGAVNGRMWISGFVSRGYYPPVGLQDKSASVHGKPATNVLLYWYKGMFGIAR